MIVVVVGRSVLDEERRRESACKRCISSSADLFVCLVWDFEFWVWDDANSVSLSLSRSFLLRDQNVAQKIVFSVRISLPHTCQYA